MGLAIGRFANRAVRQALVELVDAAGNHRAAALVARRGDVSMTEPL
jgi:hypothetical protein